MAELSLSTEGIAFLHHEEMRILGWFSYIYSPPVDYLLSSNYIERAHRVRARTVLAQEQGDLVG